MSGRPSAWRRRFARTAIGLGALAVAGFLVAASGVIPVAGSSGHRGITLWFLEFAKERSIATHTMGMDPLALDEPWLVLKGAGHYETGCRSCHGAPGRPIPRVARAMTPSPPDLAPLVAKRSPEELFYVVKHGIKFTGMPAWPTQRRDDEVRAVVAFLLALPDLDAAGYERLVFGERSSAGPAEAAVAASCARCHGEDGRGRGLAAFPRLAGQRREYLLGALEAYARDERHSGTMQAVAAELSPKTMRELADHYARVATGSPGGSESPAAAAAIERGREIATRGIPRQGVPICMDCHGPTTRPSNPAYPALAGQYADYLVLQLELFTGGRRGGSTHARLMDHVAPHLTPEQMRDVAAFYASLPQSRDPSGR
jgi:cytochrome c553